MKELFDEETLNKRIEEISNPLNWYLGNKRKYKLEDLPPIIPIIELKDCTSGRKFIFGNDIHDELILENKDNHSYLYYLNLHNYCGSKYCDEGYEFVNNGNIQGDYIEPNVQLINLAQIIDDYNKENNIDSLKNEINRLTKLGLDYGKQIEDTYMVRINQEKQIKVLEKALQLACNLLQDINYQYYGTAVDWVETYKRQAEKELKELKDDK